MQKILCIFTTDVLFSSPYKKAIFKKSYQNVIYPNYPGTELDKAVIIKKI